MKAARPSQRPFFRENVARRKFGWATEAQELAHRVRGIGYRKPWLIQAARRIAYPVRDTPQPTLFSQIFSHRADQSIKPDIAGQLRFTLDRRVAILVRLRQIKRVYELGKDNVLG